MLNHSKSYCLSLYKNKEAALYFDYFIPESLDPEMKALNLMKGIGNAYYYGEKEGIISNFLPPEFIYACKKANIKATFNKAFAYKDIYVEKGLGLEPFEWRSSNDGILFLSILDSFCDDYISKGITVLYPDSLMDYIKPEITQSESALFTISNLDLIDTENTTWEQLLAFRKDEKSNSKLRRFKNFIKQNYTGKDKEFIEDDLLQRIEDYNNVVKDWGFKTKTSNLSSFLSSKSLITTGFASLVTTSFAEPFVSLTTAIGGISIEISKIILDYSKSSHELNVFKRDHALSYLFHAKKFFN
jgi:hypothetical protein